MPSFAMPDWRHTAHVDGDGRTFRLMVLSGRFARSVLVLMMLYKFPSQRFILRVGQDRLNVKGARALARRLLTMITSC